MANNPAHEPPGKVRKRAHDQGLVSEQVSSSAAWLVENGWSILDYERHLREKATPVPAVLKTLERTCTQLDVLEKYPPDTLWEVLVAIVNRRLAKNRVCTKLDWRRRDTNREELKVFYALQMTIENSYGNDKTYLCAHFTEVIAKVGKVRGLGCDRFRALLAAFAPTDTELMQIAANLEACSREQLVSVSIVAIDESVIAYQPSHEAKMQAEKDGAPIPVVYIPRKPHPNGLECFLGCTWQLAQTQMWSRQLFNRGHFSTRIGL